MKNQEIIIHIGLHKTGTTFLQKHVFPRIESLSVIRAWDTHRKIIEFNFKEKILITDEGISGDPWNGSYLDEFKRNIRNVKRLYGDVKIIFGIRRHDEFILSLYKQYLHQKGYKDLSLLYHQDDSGMLKQRDLFFYERIAMLKEMFSNVFIYSQETLKSRPSSFFKALFLFMDVSCYFNFDTLEKKEENKGVSTKLQVEWLKRLNAINYKLLNLPFLPSLYNSKFMKYKITPRDICQIRLKEVKSDKFELPEELKMHLLTFYKDDWDKSKAYIFY
ncbi:hypothetical protein [Pseudotamlana agarivorans]|uniref:hypothetical protein n=1 Tax=Pseudotamlana agarivorans TaxID=481183 RepID=UPI00082B0289|nr:hypothetical protein [Tamlana agarivorans]